MADKRSHLSARVRGLRVSINHFRVLLAGDAFAFVSLALLVIIIGIAVIGPAYMSDFATALDLSLRNAPPFTDENGWLFWLGADALGRPLIARLIVAAQPTLLIATSAVIAAMLAGGILGLAAGYFGGLADNVIMRMADVLMSFPSLLLAIFALYVLGPSIPAVVIVLGITRMPIYIRVARAESLSIREQLFIESARAAGARRRRIIGVHITPLILPTLLTVATLDFANVMLAESALSFLGLGIQPPELSWGLMVAAGRDYLTSAWWVSLWPGFAILLTALSANLVSNWLRIAMDPRLRWRLERRWGDSDVE
ncbi:MAG: ABC transporter permease [Albidovulum sp.]|nr:ABC transporter permease [Albidovulum sp.]MDE0532593.1 ABC transporter permease [Albidovulum sp.]